MKMTVNSMKCISWSRLAIFTAAMTILSSCGGGQSGMNETIFSLSLSSKIRKNEI